MPAQQNIVVKKNNGTTDVTYTAVEPAGNGSPAVWRDQTVGNSQAHRPDYRVSVKKRGTIVEVRETFKGPQISTNSTTGLTSVVRSLTRTVTTTYDSQMPQTDVDEFVSQSANLSASAHVKDIVKTATNAA